MDDVVVGTVGAGEDTKFEVRYSDANGKVPLVMGKTYTCKVSTSIDCLGFTETNFEEIDFKLVAAPQSCKLQVCFTCFCTTSKYNAVPVKVENESSGVDVSYIRLNFHLSSLL